MVDDERPVEEYSFYPLDERSNTIDILNSFGFGKSKETDDNGKLHYKYYVSEKFGIDSEKFGEKEYQKLIKDLKIIKIASYGKDSKTSNKFDDEGRAYIMSLSSNAALFAEGKPGKEEVVLLAGKDNIQVPDESNYLDEYRQMTVKIWKANVYLQTKAGKTVISDNLLNGTKVVALAEQKGMTLVKYVSPSDGELSVGWITSSNIG